MSITSSRCLQITVPWPWTHRSLGVGKSKLRAVAPSKLQSQKIPSPDQNMYLLIGSPECSVVQWLSCVWLVETLWTAAHQAYPSSPSLRICSNLCPWSRWCHPTILSSATHFSFCFQSFLASGSFQWLGSLHQITKVLELQVQSLSFQWIFRVDFLLVQGTIRSILQHQNSKASILWPSAFFVIQDSHPYVTTGKKHWFDCTDFCRQSDVSAFQHIVWICHCFPSKEQVSFNFMVTITIHNDFRA